MDLKKGRRNKIGQETEEKDKGPAPIPLNLGPDDLVNRLHDRGFSHYTMASITRPETQNSHGKPLVSNLYSLKNNLTKPKKQKQQSILFNVPEQSYLNSQEEFIIKSKHSAFIHTTSAFFKNRPKINEYSSAIEVEDSERKEISKVNGEQQAAPISIVGYQTNNSKLSVFPKQHLSVVQKVPRQLTPITNGPLSNVQVSMLNRNMENTATNFNATGFNFGNTHSVLQPPPAQQQFSATVQSFYRTTKTSPMNPEFGKEEKNSKLVVDKLRGKVDQDKNREMRGLLPLEEVYKQAEMVKEREFMDKEAEEEAKDAKKEIKEIPPLDLYLRLVLKNNSNIDEFMYAKPEPKSENPYKLEFTEYEKDGLKEYYTVSGKGLCHYKNNQPVEFIPLKDWLDERETFKKIQSLQFFQKFRKWKTLKKWKKTCQQYKRLQHKNSLKQKLFISDEHLRTALLKHREECYNMSMLKFINLNSQVEQNEAISLPSFIDFQQKQREIAKMKIQDYSRRSRDFVEKGFDSCIKKLREANNNSDGNKGPGAGNRTNPKGTHRITETAYDALDFSKEMNYDQRSKVRNVCMTFLRFCFLVDFIALDALTKIYINSVNELKERLSTLSVSEGERILTDAEKRPNFGGKAPMFEVEVVFKENPPNEKESISHQHLKYFNYNEGTDQGPDDFKEYNVIAHPFIIDFTDQTDPLNWRSYEEYNDGREFVQLRVDNIDKMWLNVSPSIQQFKTELTKILNEGLNHLQAFERWSKHRDTLKYSAILEEWDEQIGKDNDGTSSDFLNPEDWLSLEQRPSGQQEGIVESIETAFKRSSDYLSKFKEFLQIYWEYSNLDYNMLLNEDLAKPRVTLKCIFMLIEYHTKYFESSVPFQADIGLFRLKSLELKERFTPKLTQVKEKLEEILPVEMRERSLKLLQWLKECETRMKIEVGDEDINKFIVQKKFLESTENSLPLYKKRILTVDEIYKLLSEFHVDLPKEDTQLFLNDIKTKENNIGSEIMAKNDAMNKQQEVLSKYLRTDLIPDLITQSKGLNGEVIAAKYLEFSSDQDTIIEELQEKYSRLEEIKHKAKSYVGFEEEFNLEGSDFDPIKSLEEDLTSRKVLWESLREWDTIVEENEQKILKDINVKEMEKLIEKYYANVKMCKKYIPSDNDLVKKLESMIRQFSNTIPIIFWLNIPELKEIHQKKIREMIKVESLDFSTVTLKELIDVKIFEYQGEIVNTCKQVQEEAKLDILYQQAEKEYEQLDFKLKSLRDDSKDAAFILTDIEETSATAEKIWGKINLIYSNRYLDAIKDKVMKKREEIYNFSKVLDEWIKFQGQYIYLETIFSSPDFKKELKDGGLFDRENGRYKKFAKEALQSKFKKNLKKNFIELKEINDKMSELNKIVNDFLDMKRSAMPRLHFLSNDEMIILLAKSSEPAVVQQFIGKIFENVKLLNFLPDKEKLFNAVIAREGEVYEFMTYTSFKDTIKTSSPSQINIENPTPITEWMNNLESNIRTTLFTQFKKSTEDIIEPGRKEDFYRAHPSQAISVINQVFWTYNTTQNIRDMKEQVVEKPGDRNPEKVEANPDALWNWYKEIKENIELLTTIVKSGLTGYRHKIICAVITAEVHNREVVFGLMEKGVDSIDDFEWEKQLRFEYTDDQNSEKKGGNITVRQINAVFKYGYEYIGPSSRIVITPLTDKCWITITSALNLGLGAAPAGPAGTGKTESTKDLAKALGRYCIVFNCSEQIEISLITRLFRGVCYKGAWTCLDEFNLIEIEVLSVIAQQLLEVKTVMVELTVLNRRANKESRDVRELKEQKESKEFIDSRDFKFVGKDCKLSVNSGFFITMNPGYAGRKELPDNLKVLFRPVSMMIPDYALIAEILLLSEGFSESKRLASKMKNLYKLASEQLSQQKHYDFGMRAVKSVLEMAGRLKRENPSVDEDTLLIKAMKDTNLPKFLEDDLKLFNALLVDLFPNADIREILEKDLDDAIKSTLHERGLQSESVEKFRLKIRQLNDTMNVRFGSMVIGAAMVGKSTSIQTLAQSLTKLRLTKHPSPRYKTIEYQVINPKSITMGELFGQEAPATKDWVDGLASHHIRQFTTRTDPDLQSWVVFDGPVDANWIESLNSVLDDSRLLCLANGQRIRLGDNIRLLFEVGDLKVASLATVSRCGMVFMDQKDLGWEAYMESWIEKYMHKEAEISFDGNQTFTPEIIKNLQDYIKDTLPEFVGRDRDPLEEPIEVIPLQKVRCLCDYMEVYLSHDNGFKADDNPEKKEKVVRLAFILSLAWAFGGALMDGGREKMSAIIKNRFLLHGIEESIFNLDLNYEEQSFGNWRDKVPQFTIEDGARYHDILIPTVDTVKVTYMLEKLFDINKNVLLTGGSGVGKSVLATNIFREKRFSSKFLPFPFIFSAKTTAHETQETILNSLHLESKTKRSSKPGMKNIIYIDDINMPEVEKFGSQPPIELLRQLVDLKLFYEKRELNKIEIDQTCMFGLAAPPSGGRNEMTTRFTRHFNPICLPEPDQKNLTSIFTTILKHFLKRYSKPVQNTIDPIVYCTISIYHKILKEKLPIPSKFHYTFNLRDVSKIFLGLTSSNESQIKTADIFSKLWLHETSRILHDRLIDDKDRKWFNENAIKIIEEKMQISVDAEIKTGKTKVRFTGLNNPDDNTYYQYIDKTEVVRAKVEQYLKDYNDDDRVSHKMRLVFFEDALDHFLNIFRILRYPRGNGMLVGIEGLGKQSLTRLGAYILGYIFVELEPISDNRVEAFKEYLRDKVLLPCGGPKAEKHGKKTAFLIIDSKITHDFIFEMINNLLNSGEIPNLFPAEERQKFIEELQPVVTSSTESVDPDGIYKKFIDRIRSNLHIVLSMSPIGDSLRLRCRQFPALVDCCTIDWYGSWPETALFDVAVSLVRDILDIDEGDKKPVCKIFQHFHLDSSEAYDEYFKLTGRKVYVTPKTMLDLVKIFESLIGFKKNQSEENIGVLKRGSQRLAEVKEMIADLEEEIISITPVLEKKSIDVDSRKDEVQQLSAISKEQEERCQIEEEEVVKKAAELQLSVKKEQETIGPMLKDVELTKHKIEKISTEEMSQLKGKTTLPASVDIIFRCVRVLLRDKEEKIENTPPISVVTKELIPLPKEFKKRIEQSVDILIKEGVDKFVEKNIREVDRVLKDKIKTDSNGEPVNSLKPAGELYDYLRTMIYLYDVKKHLKPTEQKILKLRKELQVSEEALESLRTDLNLFQKKSEGLRNEFDQLNSERQSLEKKLNLNKLKLVNAQELGGLLKDEEIRWKNSVRELQLESKSIVGNVLISAGIMTYLGPLPESFRKQLIAKWIEIIKSQKLSISHNYNFIEIIGDRLLLREWYNKGLPADDTSSENSIMIYRGLNWPFLIDPQMQANNWLKKTFASKVTDTSPKKKERQYEYDESISEDDEDALETAFLNQEGLKIIKFDTSHTDKLKILKAALVNGFPLLVEDAGDTLDPIIDPVINRKKIQHESMIKQRVKIDKEEVEVNPNFRLYITTKVSNPNFLPNIFIATNVINFTVTLKGLEEQMLCDVVMIENPKLEIDKNANLENMSKFKRILAQKEKEILESLNNSISSLVETSDLINQLKESKSTAESIQKQASESEQSSVIINKTRDSYRSVAMRGSILYFVIDEISKIDPMYQYSLQYINKLFTTAIKNMEREEEQTDAERNKVLLEIVTKTIYTNVSRGLFEKDKFLFSFIICVRIMLKAGDLDEKLWDIFVKGPPPYQNELKPAIPKMKGMTEFSWDNAYYLDTNVPQFQGLCSDVHSHAAMYEYYGNHSNPFQESIPDKCRMSKAKLTDFDRILLIKIIKQEKLLYSLMSFVKKNLGEYYVGSIPVNMEEVMRESDCHIPIVFVLTQGADPMSAIENIAEQKGISIGKGLNPISLGQGQGPLAQEIIERCSANGQWALLENCHLAESWMPTLEKIVEGLQRSEKVHPDFRLFLTSMPAKYFPILILQNGIKLTTEPPRGLRANMLRSLNNIKIDESMHEMNNRMKEAVMRMSMGLCYFHAIVQERIKFGPLGWNKRYEFNDSDFETSRSVLENFLSNISDQESIPWETLIFLTGTINYGGRVTDEHDGRLLMTIIARFYTPEILGPKFE